ncbi:hypothetical protein EU528_09310 [Candidatus Thorarchaeota archaeon]|nr:MAG: hypothetical protein EU528_09310 [Candidatus Thorarchaeota archaeon]
MSPDEKPTTKKRSKYLFKITVVGPDDKLLEAVLSTFDDPVVAVDGIRIGSTEIDTDTSEIHAVFMSPKHSALDILLTLTYKGASAVMIICQSSDPEIESIYRNEIRENLGTGIPTRVLEVKLPLDDFKINEIHHIFDEVVEEILEKRTQPKKGPPKTTTPKKTTSKKKAPAKTTKKKSTKSK